MIQEFAKFAAKRIDIFDDTATSHEKTRMESNNWDRTLEEIQFLHTCRRDVILHYFERIMYLNNLV
jgi:hypothetical protein